MFIDMSKLTYFTSNDQFANQFEINYELAKWIVFTVRILNIIVYTKLLII